MASKETEGDTTKMLTEQDILGAELPKPPENCTVAILKRWLSCRGAKVSGKRNELIKRFSYIPKTFGSLGRLWNFMLGEFLQLFVRLGTQQLALTMLFLVTLVFVTVNFDNGVP